MTYAEEISKGERFDCGANWQCFLDLIALCTCGGGQERNEFVFERIDGGHV